MLPLVLPHRHEIRPVEEDVGRLQHRIVEETRVHRLPSLGLLLELGHPSQVTHRRDRVEEPRELAVIGDVGLREQRAALRIDAGGHQRHGEVEHAPQQILALVLPGDRVQVDDAVEALVLVDHPRPAAEDAEIVAEMGLARGLDAAEDSLALIHGAPSIA